VHCSVVLQHKNNPAYRYRFEVRLSMLPRSYVDSPFDNSVSINLLAICRRAEIQDNLRLLEFCNPLLGNNEFGQSQLDFMVELVT
jgi:hypothetical protein